MRRKKVVFCIALPCIIAIAAILFWSGALSSLVGGGLARSVPPLQLPEVGRPLPQVTWEWPKGLGANLPKRLTVYRVVMVQAGTEQAATMARLFGLTNPVSCQGQFCTVGDGERWFSLRADGAFSYVTGKRWPEPKPGMGEPPTDDEAIGLANGFLSQRALLAQSHGFKVWGVEPAIAIRGDDLTERVVGKTVLYRRDLDGLPVLGVSRIDVDVARCDGELQVVAVSSSWRPVQAHEALPLRSVEAAQSDLEAGRGAIDLPEDAERALVQSVILAYWEDPVPARQPFVQPVYHFEGTAWVGSEPETFGGTVAALDPSVLRPAQAREGKPVAVPIVPDGPLASAAVVREGRRTTLSAQAQAALPAALVLALSENRGSVMAYAPVADLAMKAERVLGITEAAVDVTYARPVQLSISLDAAPRGLVVDGAGRSVVDLSRLIVHIGEDRIDFICLPTHQEGGHGLAFQIPRGPWSAALEQMLMGR